MPLCLGAIQFAVPGLPLSPLRILMARRNSHKKVIVECISRPKFSFVRQIEHSQLQCGWRLAARAFDPWIISAGVHSLVDSSENRHLCSPRISSSKFFWRSTVGDGKLPHSAIMLDLGCSISLSRCDDSSAARDSFPRYSWGAKCA